MSALTAAQGGLQQLTGAAQNLGGIFERMAQPFNQFTQALNPALVQQLNRAFHDMNAVIGIVAQEVTAAFIPVVKSVSSMLIPLMKTLAPIVSMLASTLGVLVTSALRPIIMAFTNLYRLLTPFYEIFIKLMSVFQAFSIIMTLFQTVFGALVRVVVELLRGLGLDKFVDVAVKVLKTFVQAIVLATAALLKFVGARAALADLLAAVDPNRAVGMGVANSPAFKSIEQMGRDQMLEAFRASGAKEQDKKAEDWLKEIHGEIADIMAKDSGQVIKDFAVTAAQEIVKSLMAIAPQMAGTFATAIANAIKGAMPALPGLGIPGMPPAPPGKVVPRMLDPFGVLP